MPFNLQILTLPQQSEEDKMLKEKLEICATRIQEKDVKQRDHSYELLCEEVKSSTSSMTSVPKPLKFLSPQYKTLKTFYES